MSLFKFSKTINFKFDILKNQFIQLITAEYLKFNTMVESSNILPTILAECISPTFSFHASELNNSTKTILNFNSFLRNSYRADRLLSNMSMSKTI